MKSTDFTTLLCTSKRVKKYFDENFHSRAQLRPQLTLNKGEHKCHILLFHEKVETKPMTIMFVQSGLYIM